MTMSQLTMMSRAHGVVYPGGMPPCAQCGLDANDPVHVNPPRPGTTMYTGEHRIVSAVRPPVIRRSHVYASARVGFAKVTCTACGQDLSASMHPPGMPVGSGARETSAQLEPTEHVVLVRHPFESLARESAEEGAALCALCGYGPDDEVHDGTPHAGASGSVPLIAVKHRAPSTPPEVTTEKAFVVQLGGKTLLAAPARVLDDGSDLPRELAAAWEKASAANPHFLWIDGRYVEADAANRNMAYWSTEDLQLGEPSVAHGPLNWLHEERHIIGTLAAAHLVKPDRETAADDRAHIRSLAAIWRYLYPSEARQVAEHSDKGTLWYSMECVSSTVACLVQDCGHSQPYGQYMSEPFSRCSHIKAGAPRRFEDPSFLGGAVIVPPVRPGWAGAHATVMRQAAMLAEQNEAAFTGLAESAAVEIVAQILRYAGVGG